MNNFIYYGTPNDQFNNYYPLSKNPFDPDTTIYTQLPKQTAIIRTIAAGIFTALAALRLRDSVFCWPIVATGIAFSCWTIYSHLLAKDPLMHTFYEIAGGKGKFDALPKIQLGQKPEEKISAAIQRIEWDKLNRPISIAQTLDGRNVVIVKGKSRDPQGFLIPCQKDTIFAFIERTGPEDSPRVISNMNELVSSALHAIVFPFTGNTFGTFLRSSSHGDGKNNRSFSWEICSTISGQMANELSAQI